MTRWEHGWLTWVMNNATSVALTWQVAGAEVEVLASAPNFSREDYYPVPKPKVTEHERNVAELHSTFIRGLGEEGWEMVAAHGGVLYFKRSLPDLATSS